MLQKAYNVRRESVQRENVRRLLRNTNLDKVIVFHLGHLILTVEDITSYFSFLDKSLHLFAHYCKDFTDLTAGDQHALLLDNAPIYFQLHLIRYTLT